MSIKDQLKKSLAKANSSKVLAFMMGMCALAIAPSCTTTHVMANAPSYQTGGRGQAKKAPQQQRRVSLTDEVYEFYGRDAYGNIVSKGTSYRTDDGSGDGYYRDGYGKWLRKAHKIENRTGSSKARRMGSSSGSKRMNNSSQPQKYTVPANYFSSNDTSNTGQTDIMTLVAQKKSERA